MAKSLGLAVWPAFLAQKLANWATQGHQGPAGPPQGLNNQGKKIESEKDLFLSCSQVTSRRFYSPRLPGLLGV